MIGPSCDEGHASAAHDGAVEHDTMLDTKSTNTTLGLECSPGLDPTIPLITDFSSGTWSTSKGRWGIDGNVLAYVYNYRSRDSSVESEVKNEALAFSGEVTAGSEDDFAGAGMHFESCVNTSMYAGLQFTLAGTSGGCAVYFELQTYSQQTISERGGCAAYCYQFPRKLVTPRSTPTTVLFSDLANTGIPASVQAMTSEIMGVRWRLEPVPGSGDAGAVACTFSLTVDDIQFVK